MPFPTATPRYAGQMLDGPERSRMRRALLRSGQKTHNLTDQEIIGAFRDLAPPHKLAEYITRPKRTSAKRHMGAVDEETYAAITALAERLGTSRGKTVTALVKLYETA